MYQHTLGQRAIENEAQAILHGVCQKSVYLYCVFCYKQFTINHYKKIALSSNIPLKKR